MNAAQIHLALNHAPLFLSALGGAILVVQYFRKNRTLTSLSLVLLVLGAIFTAPVFLTGEGTEELVENATSVNENTIGQHEEMARISMIIIVVTGVIALGTLLLRKREQIKRLGLGISLVLAIASFGTMAYTAHLGGQIRHGEIAGNTVRNLQNNNEGTDNVKNKVLKGDDDD